MARLLRFVGQLVLFLALVCLAALVAWHVLSWASRSGQALAPVVGQVYAGQPWMATPTPPPTPPPTPTPFDTATPLPSPTSTPLPTATPTPQMANQPLPTPDPFLVDVARNHGIDPAGTYVIVNQNAQRMTVVENGVVLRTIPISSGDPDRGWYTPGWSGVIGEYWGTFTANGATADDAWYLFQAGGSILIHSLPYTLLPDGSKAYQGQDELGIFPASRGCIRLDPEEARWFTGWGPYGVPVVVLPWDSGTGRSG
jgi:lipoprotein-anchoring transpeptidase ErfK/SrfK